ncbi:MAG: SIS domain-containing protein [Anaerolineae bacterium]|nr:SIS domain-containing protein [Anaerolineae bacterium]
MDNAPSILRQEFNEQPKALRQLASLIDTSSIPTRPASHSAAIILSGMGASYHAALALLPYFHSLKIPAFALEATDLLYYSEAILQPEGMLILISQSGESGEIVPLLKKVPTGMSVLAITNHPASSLAQQAQCTIPIHAGAETLVATKTYLNTLAALWLLARKWGGIWDGSEADRLNDVADRCEQLLNQADSLTARCQQVLNGVETLLFVGHGPQAATARQSAMMVSEWAKLPALWSSVGAYRHGSIEAADARLGVVCFTAPGRTYETTRRLAEELNGYGAQILIVSNGYLSTLHDSDPIATPLDEYLSPMLDVIPIQLFIDTLAIKRRITPGFRHIAKVVTNI